MVCFIGLPNINVYNTCRVFITFYYWLITPLLSPPSLIFFIATFVSFSFHYQVTPFSLPLLSLAIVSLASPAIHSFSLLLVIITGHTPSYAITIWLRLLVSLAWSSFRLLPLPSGYAWTRRPVAMPGSAHHHHAHQSAQKPRTVGHTVITVITGHHQYHQSLLSIGPGLPPLHWSVWVIVICLSVNVIFRVTGRSSIPSSPP